MENLSISSLPCTLVWISPSEARIYSCDHGDPTAAPRLTRIDRADGFSDPQVYFHEIASGLPEATRVVILGPDLTKFLWRTYLQEHVPRVYRRIVGFEACANLSSREFAELHAKYGE